MKVNESQLRKIIQESVKKVLKEINDSNSYEYVGKLGYDVSKYPLFVNGYAMICNDDKGYNFIDEENRIVSPNIWFYDANNFSYFQKGDKKVLFAVVKLNDEDMQWHYLDTYGNIYNRNEIKEKGFNQIPENDWKPEWMPYDGWRP